MLKRFGLVAMAMVLTPAVAAQDVQLGTLTVTGNGHAEVWPDRASVRLGVRQEATAGDTAMAAMATDMTAVLAQLATLGFVPEDIETSRLNLQPIYDYEGEDRTRKTVGYVATQNITVTIIDMTQISAVLDLAVSGVANRLDGISFDVIDDAPGQEAARIDAVTQARLKAEQYAAAAGVTLGAIISLSDEIAYAEGGFAIEILEPPVTDENGNVIAAPAVPVSPRAVDYGAEVTMVWAIE